MQLALTLWATRLSSLRVFPGEYGASAGVSGLALRFGYKTITTHAHDSVMKGQLLKRGMICAGRCVWPPVLDPSLLPLEVWTLDNQGDWFTSQMIKKEQIFV